MREPTQPHSSVIIDDERHDAAIWDEMIVLSECLGTNWMLIGGQMTMLLSHVFATDMQPRASHDIDVVLDVRSEPGILQRVHDSLTGIGMRQLPPDAEGIAHRYAGQTGIVVDVLAPDHLGTRARLRLGAGSTVSVPDSVSAVVIKASARYQTNQTRRESDRHLYDLRLLLPILSSVGDIDPPLTKSERRLFRRMSEDADLRETEKAIAAAACGAATESRR